MNNARLPQQKITPGSAANIFHAQNHSHDLRTRAATVTWADVEMLPLPRQINIQHRNKTDY